MNREVARPSGEARGEMPRRLAALGVPLAPAKLMRARVCAVIFASATVLTVAARADEPPLPAGVQLRGTVEADAIREVPELKGARINRNRDESVAGVRVLDQTWDGDVGYRDAVRFYDRAFAGADTLVIEREEADTTTGWLVRLADGTVTNVTVRNTRPTSIEIQRVVP